MTKVISIEIYYAFIALFFVVDTTFYMIFRNKAKKLESKLIRSSFMFNFLILGLVVTIDGSVNPLTAAPPAILASIVVWYIMFVKYPPTVSRL